MAIATRVYIGAVKEVRLLNAHNDDARPRIRFQWSCSCGATNSTKQNEQFPDIPDSDFWHFDTRMAAETSLDEHMMSEHSRIKAGDTDEIIAMSGAHGEPLVVGDEVEVVATNHHLFGRRGTITDFIPFPGVEDRVMLHLSEGAVIDTPIFAHSLSRVHTHEDPQHAIERPPSDDARDDVRRIIPTRTGDSDDAQKPDRFVIARIPFDEYNKDFPTIQPLDSRWRLFNASEREEILRALQDLGATRRPGVAHAFSELSELEAKENRGGAGTEA